MQSTTSYRASNVSSFPVILYRDRKYLAKTLLTDTSLHSPLNNILYEDKKAKNTSIKTEASEILSQKEDWNTINRKKMNEFSKVIIQHQYQPIFITDERRR